MDHDQGLCDEPVATSEKTLNLHGGGELLYFTVDSLSYEAIYEAARSGASAALKQYPNIVDKPDGDGSG
jgi:hypothetical protein